MILKQSVIHSYSSDNEDTFNVLEKLKVEFGFVFDNLKSNNFNKLKYPGLIAIILYHSYMNVIKPIRITSKSEFCKLRDSQIKDLIQQLK